MRQSQSYAMRCTSIVLLLHLVFLLVGCGGFEVQSDKEERLGDFKHPKDLIAALQKNPARTLQTLHTTPNSLAKDSLIINTVEQFPHRSKPLCPILSTEISIERCLRLTERPHLWKKQPHHFAKSTHPSKQVRKCTIDPHPNTCWTAQALLDSNQDWTLAKDACRQIEDDVWKAECFFTLAESITVEQDTLQKALDTCSYSDQFQKSCWLHIIVQLAQNSFTAIHDSSWLEETNSILDNSRIPNEMKPDLWQHFLAKGVATAFEHDASWSNTTPIALTGHWQNQYAVEALRQCDVPIQGMPKWIQIARDASSTCTKLNEPRGMDLESDLWVSQSLPKDCEIISFLGESHRIHCPKNDDFNWHMALLEASVRLRPNNAIFVQESLQSSNATIQKRAQHLHALNWQEKPDQRK